MSRPYVARNRVSSNKPVLCPHGVLGIRKCSECRREYDKAWREQNRDTHLAQRRARRKAAYQWPEGVTFETCMAAQDRACAICRVSFQDVPRKHVHVDHDHESGRVRGLLCHHCNIMLGLARDSVATLRAAIEYLEVV